MGAHALLGPSKAKQWLLCTPSVRLEEQVAKKEESSVYAQEGTAAHALCEYKLKKFLHEQVGRRPVSEFDSEEMENCSDIYAEFITEIIEKIRETCPNPLVLVEEKLDFSHIVPGGFGTGDCVIIADKKLYVVDYKHGQGVFVHCEGNPQMRLYALGAYHMFQYLYPIETVSMTIVQPRLDNISTDECTIGELLDWGENYVRPRAQLAYKGEGDFVPGEEQCRFCKAKHVCRACAEDALALAREEFLDLDADVVPLTEEADTCVVEETDATAPYNRDDSAPTFKQPAFLSKGELEEILPTLNRISSWIDAVFAFVSSEAINHGVRWKGWKVVEGRSVRRFTDTKAVEDAAAMEGYTQLYRQQMLSLTEIEKLMGKKRFREILGKFVEKPPGKLALVRETDPRPEVDLTTAEDEFAALD
ncbi:MAG: DUF2800 domain-containing protein [Clostridiaceae bacterium]|nr:DUF2800 domain-containing protein [Clostridiaceae bacterium]